MSNKNNNIEETTAKVKGIYSLNKPIREKALASVWGKYNMLPDILTESLGKLYDIVEDVYFSDKNEKSLFNFTHDKLSVYSRSIAEKNLTVGENNTQPIITETPRDAYNAWYNTAYQGKNYYETIKDYRHSFGGNPYITYNDNMSSSNNSDYTYIDYDEEINIEYSQLTAATQYSKDNLDSLKRPKRNSFPSGDEGKEAYKNALEERKEKKGKRRRQEKRDAKDEYSADLEAQNEFIKEPKTLLMKTSKLFKEKKIDSLVSRLYGGDGDKEFVDTAKTTYGKSRGRDLLKFNPNSNDPFCRTWAAHRQYGKEKNSLIRPFSVTGKSFEESELVKAFRTPTGGKYLQDYSILKNGFVKITPENDGNNKYDTKRCMFSIENLAWKDVYINKELSQEQIGPNGGRIMWFPPYDLQFQETSQANWNETNFIGRGEPIYTYTNTKRTGTLSFTLLIDHPSIINEFNNRSKNERDTVNPDNDILRFFAGCDFPMELMGAGESAVTYNYGIKKDEYSTNDGECSEVTVNVYFPYGYSGNMNINGDKDWSDYLFCGFNIDGGKIDKDYARGYEISSAGISNDDNELNEPKIGYRVDQDFTHINELSDKELKDKNSYLLNNSCGDDNEISFAELYILKLLLDNKTTISQDELEFAKKNNILNNNAIIEGNKLKSETNIFYNKKAQEILDNRGFGIYKIHIDYVDAPNEKTPLGFKRAGKIEELIKKLGTEKECVINKESIECKNKKIHKKKSKKCRRVTAKIKYNLPESEITTPTLLNPEVESEKNKNNKRNSNTEVTKSVKYPNYNEGDYFKNLEYIDNFTYQTISEKIKYFDPAYHSISPEGFNSRLTFLHQCTRQGHTLERKESDRLNVISTAGNMAFGRPPFCVLRIGDFINTKILIRSVNIVYQNGNGMQWDMNPEGIGVQPMFAKVTLQIELIGGQSLDAPVSRLNNAVSFNYYANTGVYDNRTDRAIYGDDGEITYSNLYEIERK